MIEGSGSEAGSVCGICNIFMPMISSVQLLARPWMPRPQQEEDSLQIVKIVNCNDVLFYCLVHRRAQ
jgi:hypothetical protein